MESINVIWTWSDGATHQKDFTRQELAKIIRGWRKNSNITLTVNGFRSVTSKTHGISAHITWGPKQ